MVELTTDLMAWLETLSPVLMYAVLLAVSFGENVLPPVPGDLLIVFAGYLAGLGTLGLIPVILIASIGGAVGFMVMFAVGRRIGPALTDSDRMKWLPKRRLKKALWWIERHGYLLVAGNRFLSGTRSVISLGAGMSGMKSGPVAFYCTVSALLWTGLLAWLGYAVGENWEVVGVYLKRYGQVILALVLMFGVGVLLRGIWIRRPDEAG